MRPTELGNAFLAHAERIDLQAGDLYAALRDLRQAKAGTLRLGIGQGIPDRFVVAIAQVQTSSGVSLDLSGGMTDSLQRAVAVGDSELALIGLAGVPRAGLKWIPLCDDPMQPMGAPDSAAGGRRLLQWSELAVLPWIVPAPGTASFEEFESNFRRHGLEPPTPIVASRMSNREIPLALALKAIVLMTRSLAEEPSVRAQFRLVRPEGGWPSRRKLGIVHRDGGYLSPAARKAMSTIRELLAR